MDTNESALTAAVNAYGGRRIPQALPILVNLGAVRHDLGVRRRASTGLDAISAQTQPFHAFHPTQQELARPEPRPASRLGRRSPSPRAPARRDGSSSSARPSPRSPAAADDRGRRTGRAAGAPRRTGRPEPA